MAEPLQNPALTYTTIASLPTDEAKARATKLAKFLSEGLTRLYAEKPGTVQKLKDAVAAGDVSTTGSILMDLGAKPADWLASAVNPVLSGPSVTSVIQSVPLGGPVAETLGHFGDAKDALFNAGSLLASIADAKPGQEVTFTPQQAERIAAGFEGSYYEHMKGALAPKPFWQGLMSGDFMNYISAGLTYLMENYLPTGWGGSDHPRSIDQIISANERASALKQVRDDLVSGKVVDAALADTLSGQKATDIGTTNGKLQVLGGDTLTDDLGDDGQPKQDRTVKLAADPTGWDTFIAGASEVGTAIGAAGSGMWSAARPFVNGIVDGGERTVNGVNNGNVGAIVLGAAEAVTVAKIGQNILPRLPRIVTAPVKWLVDINHRSAVNSEIRGEKRGLNAAGKTEVDQAAQAARQQAELQGLDPRAAEAAEKSARKEAAAAVATRTEEQLAALRKTLTDAERGVISRGVHFVDDGLESLARYSWIRPIIRSMRSGGRAEEVVEAKPVDTTVRTQDVPVAQTKPVNGTVPAQEVPVAQTNPVSTNVAAKPIDGEVLAQNVPAAQATPVDTRAEAVVAARETQAVQTTQKAVAEAAHVDATVAAKANNLTAPVSDALRVEATAGAKVGQIDNVLASTIAGEAKIASGLAKGTGGILEHLKVGPLKFVAALVAGGSVLLYTKSADAAVENGSLLPDARDEYNSLVKKTTVGGLLDPTFIGSELAGGKAYDDWARKWNVKGPLYDALNPMLVKTGSLEQNAGVDYQEMWKIFKALPAQDKLGELAGSARVREMAGVKQQIMALLGNGVGTFDVTTLNDAQVKSLSNLHDRFRELFAEAQKVPSEMVPLAKLADLGRYDVKKYGEYTVSELRAERQKKDSAVIAQLSDKYGKEYDALYANALEGIKREDGEVPKNADDLRVALANFGITRTRAQYADAQIDSLLFGDDIALTGVKRIETEVAIAPVPKEQTPADISAVAGTVVNLKPVLEEQNKVVFQKVYDQLPAADQLAVAQASVKVASLDATAVTSDKPQVPAEVVELAKLKQQITTLEPQAYGVTAGLDANGMTDAAKLADARAALQKAEDTFTQKYEAAAKNPELAKYFEQLTKDPAALAESKTILPVADKGIENAFSKMLAGMDTLSGVSGVDDADNLLKRPSMTQATDKALATAVISAH